MGEHCHRCQGELPGLGPGGSNRDEDAVLFCPRCSAPQIKLLEHMQAEAEDATSTTGTLPPPPPQAIEWRVALGCGAVVAGTAAVLAVAGLWVPVASFANFFWVTGGAAIALGFYKRQRPRARVDGGVGLRIGVATGVLMVAAMGTSLAVTGGLVRFGMHRMGNFDAELTQQFGGMEAQMATKLQQQGQGRAVQEKVLGFMGSQEVRGGFAVAELALLGGAIVLLSMGGGAFAGRMRSRPRGVSEGE